MGNVKIFLDDAVKDMEIPFKMLQNGKYYDAITTPGMLFDSLNKVDKKITMLKKNNKSLKRSVIFLGIGVGLLIIKNNNLKKEVRECKKETETIHMDTQ